MKTSDDGVALLQFFEHCALVAYPDPCSKSGDPWTIGFGDTGPDVVRGLCITRDEAEGRLARRLATEFEPGVMTLLTVIPDQCQFDAFVDFAYNEGLKAFSNSRLLARFNDMGFVGCADEFLHWDMAGGHEVLGLLRRRTAERARYLGASAVDAIAEAESVLSL